MKKKEISSDIIEISDAKINVSKVVEAIRKEIGKKKVAYLKELNQNLPSILNTAENSEYLLEGWYESDVIGGQRARWTKQEFSFLFNPGGSKRINLEIVSTPPDVSEHFLGLAFFVGGKLICKKRIISTGGQILWLPLANNFRSKNLTVKIRLSRTFCPAQLTKGGDIRQLGIGISKISNTRLTNTGSKYLPELAGYETMVLMQAERVRLHANPETFLPKGTKLKFLKLLILRIIKVFTSVQTTFNYYVAELFKNINAQNKLLGMYVSDVDTKVAALNGELRWIDHYVPIYWDEHQDDFYEFHQACLRGNESKIENLLKVYLSYLNRPDFYKKNPLIDFGSGRGEFLELLRKERINSLGVDINDKFVKLCLKKNLKVVNFDAISYLQTLKDGYLGGVSAFHLVEHFTFPQLFDFLFLVKAKLIKDGLLILETPNPDNTIVAAEHFYNDFTHKTKLSPILLSKLCEYIGFKNIKIVPLHPEKGGKLTGMDVRLYGPMDYALIANK
ncbi:class I SAM-dependent methyltransferase [Patescibacteria group bacterium]|nr:class I SAM-dependent methyltransferase [Patescibacteria group bacterium]